MICLTAIGHSGLIYLKPSLYFHTGFTTIESLIQMHLHINENGFLWAEINFNAETLRGEITLVLFITKRLSRTRLISGAKLISSAWIMLLRHSWNSCS